MQTFTVRQIIEATSEDDFGLATNLAEEAMSLIQAYVKLSVNSSVGGSQEDLELLEYIIEKLDQIEKAVKGMKQTVFIKSEYVEDCIRKRSF